MLRVNELFYSVQGEGRFTGYPALFIRLHGCPVGCSFCDTKNTWITKGIEEVPAGDILEDRPRPKRGWANISVTDLLQWVIQTGHPDAIVVITGGEPLAQDEVYELVVGLKGLRRQVQIETSGTFDHKVFELLMDSDDEPENPWITVSPKFEGNLPVVEGVLRKASEIKVVMSSEQIATWVRETVEVDEHSRRRMCLQPETGPQFAISSAMAVRLCKEYGLKLSLQSHTFLNIR